MDCGAVIMSITLIIGPASVMNLDMEALEHTCFKEKFCNCSEIEMNATCRLCLCGKENVSNCRSFSNLCAVNEYFEERSSDGLSTLNIILAITFSCIGIMMIAALCYVVCKARGKKSKMNDFYSIQLEHDNFNCDTGVMETALFDSVTMESVLFDSVVSTDNTSLLDRGVLYLRTLQDYESSSEDGSLN